MRASQFSVTLTKLPTQSISNMKGLLWLLISEFLSAIMNPPLVPEQPIIMEQAVEGAAHLPHSFWEADKEEEMPQATGSAP